MYLGDAKLVTAHSQPITKKNSAAVKSWTRQLGSWSSVNFHRIFLMYRTHYIIESLHWFTFFSETTIFNGKKPWFPVSIFPTKPIQGFFDESQASHYGKMTINHKPSFDHGTYAAHIYI